MDDLASYDYDLPPELIAAEPLPERDCSRLLVVERTSGALTHRSIRDLPGLLRAGDCLVLNDTLVVPARLFGYREATGGKWEGLFLEALATGEWRLIGQSGGKLHKGETIVVVPAHSTQATSGVPEGASSFPAAVAKAPNPQHPLRLTFIECDSEGIWTAQPSTDRAAFDVLKQVGTVPLPPYVGRKRGSPIDWQRYQTIYGRRPGAVAAPTAGLHFTPELLAECVSRGIKTAFVTLHVGIGTFRPITAERLSDHVMHCEWCEISEETSDELERTRRAGGRIVAVGTTSVRTLETASCGIAARAFCGPTDLFIRPPYEFRAVDCLLTNFHLPRSSLLVLVSALAGLELIRRAYEAAIQERYRFYSYGDAMLIV